jgi:CRP-like cAMP-binding protein
MYPVSLPRSGILAFLDDEARKLLAGYGTFQPSAAGQILIREGESNTHLYIVVDGSFSIYMNADGKEVVLDTVGIGDCLGEVAIFHPDRASATVRSLEAGKLWSIEAEALQQFLFDHPNHGCATMLGIDIILSRRLKRANAVIRLHEIVPGFLSVRSRKRAETAKLR